MMSGPVLYSIIYIYTVRGAASRFIFLKYSQVWLIAPSVFQVIGFYTTRTAAVYCSLPFCTWMVDDMFGIKRWTLSDGEWNNNYHQHVHTYVAPPVNLDLWLEKRYGSRFSQTLVQQQLHVVISLLCWLVQGIDMRAQRIRTNTWNLGTSYSCCCRLWPESVIFWLLPQKRSHPTVGVHQKFLSHSH